MVSQRPDLKEIVEKLDAEPLTHLMLGHHEVFHSNLLAWFFNCLKDESDDVFEPLTKSDNTEKGEIRRVDFRKGQAEREGRVEREKKKLGFIFLLAKSSPTSDRKQSLLPSR
jgi:hypothetical protein